MEKISRTWAEFKALVDLKQPPHQYADYGTSYTLWFDEPGIRYECIIHKKNPAGADQTAFEADYKASANAAASSLPRPKMNGSPPLSRTTVFPSRAASISR